MTTSYERLRLVARVATTAPVIVAITYTIGLSFLLVTRITLYSPDFLLGSVMFLSPLLLAITYIAWKWPAPGGLLTLVTGFLLLFGILSSNWGVAYEIPYVVFCSVFIIGGILQLAWFILNGIPKGGKK